MKTLRPGTKLWACAYEFDNNKDKYLYPHDYPGAWVYQQYLPDKIKDVKYYIPKDSSKYEEALKEAKETTKNYCVTLQDNLQKARNMDKLKAIEDKQEEERAKARLAYEKQIATIKDSMSIKEPEADVKFDVVGNFVADTTRADEILKMTNASLNGEETIKQIR